MPTDLCRTAPSTTPCHHTMDLCLVEPRAPAKGPGVAWGTSTAFGSRGCGPGPSPGALSSSHLLPCEYQPLSLLPLPLQPLSSPRTDSKSCPRKQNDGHHCPMSGCRHSAVTVTTTPPACPWVTWGCGKVSTPPQEPHKDQHHPQRTAHRPSPAAGLRGNTLHSLELGPAQEFHYLCYFKICHFVFTMTSQTPECQKVYLTNLKQMFPFCCEVQII